MQKQLDFEVKVREERGKNESRRLRTTGLVPGVLYGLGKETIAISLSAKDMTQLLKSHAGPNQILNLKVDGVEKSAAMAIDWQVDPVKGNLLHVDVQRIDLSETVTVRVRIETNGVPLGVREQGGVEEIVTREIEIESLPLDVPAMIEMDVTDLEIGDAIRLRDLPTSDKYTFLTPPDQVLVHVVAPRVEVVEEEEVPAEGEEAAAAAGEAPADEKDKEKDKEKTKEEADKKRE